VPYFKRMKFFSIGWRKITITAMLLFLVTVALGAWPLPALLIEDAQKTRPVFVQRVLPGDQLALGFLHSVEKCRVWDHLSIGPEYDMVVVATEFAESRTGLPYAAFGDEVFERLPDHFRISNMHRRVPEIYQWVNDRYENTLRINGGPDISLASLAGKTLLHIRVVKMPVAQWVWLKAKLYWQHRNF
jgi:hypothetical protein